MHMHNLRFLVVLHLAESGTGRGKGRELGGSGGLQAGQGMTWASVKPVPVEHCAGEQPALVSKVQPIHSCRWEASLQNLEAYTAAQQPHSEDKASLVIAWSPAISEAGIAAAELKDDPSSQCRTAASRNAASIRSV